MSATELLDAPTTAIAKPQPINWTLLREQALASFDIQSELIAKEVEADTAITVSDANTRKAANTRRMVWVRRRTDLGRTKTAAAAEAKKIVVLVKEVAESFQAEFSKAEDHLASQIDAFDAAVAAAEKEKADAAYNAKNSQLLHVGIELQRFVVDSLTDEQIADMIDEKIITDRLKREEQERIAAAKAEADRAAAAQAEANRIEAEKLAAERAEFARLQAAQKAEMDAQRKLLEEAQRKIEEAAFAVAEREREQREAEQQAERNRVFAEAKAEADAFEAERLKIVAEQAAKDAAEKFNREEIERKAAADRFEALQPDRIKLLLFADGIQGTQVVRVAQQDVMALIAMELLNCADAIRRIVEERVR